jgi:hypothetical protein
MESIKIYLENRYKHSYKRLFLDLLGGRTYNFNGYYKSVRLDLNPIAVVQSLKHIGEEACILSRYQDPKMRVITGRMESAKRRQRVNLRLVSEKETKR